MSLVLHILVVVGLFAIIAVQRIFYHRISSRVRDDFDNYSFYHNYRDKAVLTFTVCLVEAAVIVAAVKSILGFYLDQSIITLVAVLLAINFSFFCYCAYRHIRRRIQKRRKYPDMNDRQRLRSAKRLPHY